MSLTLSALNLPLKRKLTPQAAKSVEEKLNCINLGVFISKIYNVYPFAGIGTNEPLVKAGTLAKQNGGAPDKWCHKAGYTVVSMGEKDFYAELHWFENDEVGQVGFKIKNRNKEE